MTLFLIKNTNTIIMIVYIHIKNYELYIFNPKYYVLLFQINHMHTYI